MSDNNINDPKNVTGMSNLFDNDDIESTIDLAELERQIALGSDFQAKTEVNLADDYKMEMEKLSRNYDLGITDEPSVPAMTPAPVQSFVEEPAFSPPSPVDVSEPYSRNAYNSPVSGAGASAVKHDSMNWNAYRPRDEQINSMTMEERKQEHINDVLHDINDKELQFDIEREKDEDERASLLEQIDMLKITLEDDGIDISNVPEITKTSSMADVHNVYKILRLKNDRNRYCSFAEELILSGAYGLEYLFDGEKEWFNKKPDLTGWSSTVKVKLRRMRFETSTFVKEVMQEYNMSAGMRLALELIPSMFLYSRKRRVTHNDNLASDSDYKDAISKLNSM